MPQRTVIFIVVEYPMAKGTSKLHAYVENITLISTFLIYKWRISYFTDWIPVLICHLNFRQSCLSTVTLMGQELSVNSPPMRIGNREVCRVILRVCIPS